mmetsp:Transcript_8817/g.21578  ORF Transcript_8817/g.21578 Transcript_8817/m.21578 type:complete len:256 (+) Transcript_8817:120-887(+)
MAVRHYQLVGCLGHCSRNLLFDRHDDRRTTVRYRYYRGDAWRRRRRRRRCIRDLSNRNRTDKGRFVDRRDLFLEEHPGRLCRFLEWCFLRGSSFGCLSHGHIGNPDFIRSDVLGRLPGTTRLQVSVRRGRLAVQGGYGRVRLSALRIWRLLSKGLHDDDGRDRNRNSLRPEPSCPDSVHFLWFLHCHSFEQRSDCHCDGFVRNRSERSRSHCVLVESSRFRSGNGWHCIGGSQAHLLLGAQRKEQTHRSRRYTRR